MPDTDINNHGSKRLLLLTESADAGERLGHILAAIPYTTFVAANPGEVSPGLKLDNYDLVVFHTGKNASAGLNLLQQLQAEEILCCVVIVAEDPTLEDAVMAMRSGCANFLDFKSLDASLRPAVEQGLKKTLALRATFAQRIRDTQALQMAQARLATMETQNQSLQKATEDALLSSLEMREPNSRVHSLRLKAYATHLAKLIGYPASVLPHLQSAAMLHDIGKLGLPFDILNNPGVLPATQLEALRPHTWLGERILNDITFLRPAARMVRHHHERWDGSGYPDKLTGENIPQGSRILAIVDTLDAITNEQTYRPAQTFQEAISEIARWSGRQFDPALIAEFRRVPAKTWAQLREEVESSYKPLSTPQVPTPTSQNPPAA